MFSLESNDNIRLFFFPIMRGRVYRSVNHKTLITNRKTKLPFTSRPNVIWKRLLDAAFGSLRPPETYRRMSGLAKKSAWRATIFSPGP